MSYFRTFLFAIALLVLNQGQAQAFSLPGNFHTQSTPLVLEPVSDFGIKVAGVYWLPDYLDKNLDFNGGGENPKVDPTCNNLGYAAPAFVTDWSKYDYTEFSAANKVRCYKNFSCKAGFSKSSCDPWYQLAGNTCTDARGTFYERCDPKPCPSGYSTAVTSCGSGYSFAANGMSGGSICGVCNQRGCSDGGYYDSNPNSGIYKCNAVTWGGKNCYSCYQPQCTEGGYQTGSSKTGYICKAKPYYGRSCYDCLTPDPCYNITDYNPCRYGCETTYAQCTGKCSKCYADNCRNCTAVIASCPSNATCSKFSDCSSKISSWGCNSGYIKSGNSCVAENCPIGYDISVTSCSIGYRLETNGTSKGKICGKCGIAPCPSGSYVGYCGVGETHDGAVGYSGNQSCIICRPMTCDEINWPRKGVTDPSSCGRGRFWSRDTRYRGPGVCGSCPDLPCPDGSDVDRLNFQCVSGYVKTVVGYTGDRECLKCVKQ